MIAWPKPLAVVVVAVGCLVACGFGADDNRTASAVETYPFFAFQNGLNGVPLKEQPKLLKALGYDGIELDGRLEQIPAMLKALDAAGLKLFCVYTGVCLDPGIGAPSYDPHLKAVIEALRGRDTILTIHFLGGKPSATDRDDRAVAVLREIADMAAPATVRIALYPHVQTYVERVQDGVRLARKVGRQNVGVAFNLCHFLKRDDAENLEKRLAEAMPYLFVVSINGADSGATNQMDWNRLIQTLDQGSFDVGRVLRALRKLHYAGPVGLQCFAIPGPPHENLKRSMKAWRNLCSRMNAAIALLSPEHQ